MIMNMSISQFVFGILGDVAGFFLFLAPARTFVTIAHNSDTAQFSGIPYVMSVLNCLLSLWYGIVANKLLVIIVNGLGTIMELIYVLLFIKFSIGQQRIWILSLFTTCLCIFGLVALVSHFAFQDEKNGIVFCGYAAAISGVLMYGSPFSVMKIVIQTRSVNAMPLLLSLCSLVCASVWLVYGIVAEDYFVLVPNALGTASGILQLILYARYYS